MNNLIFLSTHLFDTDIALINQILRTYKSFQDVFNQPLLGTGINMGAIYLLFISGTLAPVLGKFIGESINKHKGV